MGVPSGPARRIAVLGTGVMGGAMARLGVKAGLDVTGWSEPLTDAEPLASDGVSVAPTAAAAVAEAEVVVTMVPDAAAIESFALGPAGFLEAMPADAVWVQSSTVGVEAVERVIELAARHDVTLVDAPVLGSKGPVERGELVVLASGDEWAIERCSLWFDAISRRVLRLGAAGHGSRLKTVVNHWVMCSVGAIAETLALAEALGLDGRHFIEAIAGSEVDMGYAQIKGAMMVARSYPVQGSLAIGAKDATFASSAARSLGLASRIGGATSELFERALALRSGRTEDMAAAFEAARERHDA